MSAVLQESPCNPDSETPDPVIVVGTGPVGIRMVEELLRNDASMPIRIFGDEPWEPYNRVRLSSLFSGELTLGGIQNPLKLPEQHRVVQYHNCEIISIDRDKKQVTDRLGNVHPYSHLVLATGSKPHIPNIEGIDKGGIYTFRNLNDTQQLMARRTRCRRAVVLGGGLLGLEAARGLQKHHTAVFVVEHASRLMAQQLDEGAAELLREEIMSLDIRVVLGDSVKRISGDQTINGIELRSGRHIDCDTLVIATGIRPNIQLALDAKLSVGRGIRVNDNMQTSDLAIYAVGECAEHRDRIYGLVAPGWEQAGVAAHCMAGGRSRYTGSRTATRLKVLGTSVFSMGRRGEHDSLSQLQSITYRGSDNKTYRRLFVNRNRLVGAVAYGNWPQTNRVQEALTHARYLWPWQRRRFLRTGQLWPEQDTSSVSQWPSSAIVCQCANVSRGCLSQAIQSGHCSVEALGAATGASTVCGSCKPLVTELLGNTVVEAEPDAKVLVSTAVVTLLLAFAFLLLPAIPSADSVQLPWRWDALWRDSLLKQITGFSVLGAAFLISLIGLRKRTKRITFGAFPAWRSVHVVLGTLVLGTLVAHTGLHLGDKLNLFLMLDFLALLLAGTLAGATIGLQHRLPSYTTKRVRSLSLWAHILLLWPLPALLGFHVLKSYWF